MLNAYMKYSATLIALYLLVHNASGRDGVHPGRRAWPPSTRPCRAGADMGGFANEYTAPVAEFGPDPRARLAAGLLTSIWTRLQGARTHPYGPMKGKDPSITFNGVAEPPQGFRGFSAPLGSGTPYRNGSSPQLDTGLVEGPLGDPARRIFAQRLARRNSVGGM
jgi:hypothetical protein